MNKRKLVEDLTGVILSGGKSSRMGVNKSLLKIDGVTLIEKTYNMMKSVFKNVLISTNDPGSYDFLTAVKVEDLYKGFGPLGGIHASLKYVPTDKIFIVSSDMPFILPAAIKFLMEIETDEPILLPKAESRVQYLCGIYSKKIIPVTENILSSNKEALDNKKEIIKSSLSLWNIVERIGAEIVDMEDKIFYMKDLFFNINTPDDFEYVRDHLF